MNPADRREALRKYEEAKQAIEVEVTEDELRIILAKFGVSESGADQVAIAKAIGSSIVIGDKAFKLV